ncbi:TM2 domain-containing protein [Marinigracilibium pacificum]|uniref:TM2 domain-containing protein n=1 Tax=Marinigracilibium pacificum TaxID=2729599 RepID=A0A848IX27_9BACT|nr:TM2 domain-containing protein [Marinigracilibium pacificum]NMM48867.1 TM2 domain-containing protein [Marinigracilibium pacificum]
MHQRIIQEIPGVEGEEILMVNELTKEMSNESFRTFSRIYSGKRKSSEIILVLTILGFFGVAGIQRIITGEIGLGILYLFTAGLCFIGTIVDLVNYKRISLEYNQKMAVESVAITQSLMNQ